MEKSFARVTRQFEKQFEESNTIMKTIDTLMNDYIQGNISDVEFNKALDEIIEFIDALPDGADLDEAIQTIKNVAGGRALEAMDKENSANRLFSISRLPWLHVPATFKNRLSIMPYKRSFFKRWGKGGKGEKTG